MVDPMEVKEDSIKQLKRVYDDGGDEKEEGGVSSNNCRVDRISELPEFIIHHILSFLESPQEIARTSVLSKRWYRDIWTSIPFLTMSENDICRGLRRLRFRDYVEKSLLRYEINGFRINKFCLGIALKDSSVVSMVDKWVTSLVQNHQIQELDLQLSSPGSSSSTISFSLPQSFFSASKSLKVLKLDGCSITSCSDKIAFRYLQSLCLQRVSLCDQKVLNHIISSCTLLEEIVLNHCSGLKKLKLSGLDKLRYVRVKAGRSGELELIDIKAPSLESFSFGNGSMHDLHIPGLDNDNGNGRRDKMPRIEMGGCKNLKVLCLMYVAKHGRWFHDFIAQFPLLQELRLVNCSKIERLRISSPCLKRLELASCSERLLEAEIEAPNLVSFRYFGVLLPPISSTNNYNGCGGAWEACLTTGYVDTAWFLRLREFLSISKHFKVVSTVIDFDMAKVDNGFHELSATSTPTSFQLENLKLGISNLSSNYPAVVDALFWSCCPRELTLAVSTDLINSLQHRTGFIEYLYKKLKHIGHICCCCCRDNGRHWCANNVEIEISERGLNNRRPIELSVLLDILPTMTVKNYRHIHFRRS